MQKMKFTENQKDNFYDSYFESNDHDVFRFDVGSFCTRHIIIKSIKHTNGNLLEIGTGMSSLLEDVPQFNRFGIDISANTIDMVQRYFKQKNIPATLCVADAESIPFEDNTFDVIITSHTFEHIKNDTKAFQECARILKPGGELIIFVPGRIDGTATQEEWETLGHYRSYNKKQFLDFLHIEPRLSLRSIHFPHKMHNLIWNRLKHFVRILNYPIKKWILRDNKTYEIRPLYQKIFFPFFIKTLNSLDALVMKKEKNFCGTEFNVLACFEKLNNKELKNIK